MLKVLILSASIGSGHTKAAEAIQKIFGESAQVVDFMAKEISGGTVEELAKFYPLGRIGTPAEVAEAIYFLANANFITGAILSVDGGLTC